MENSLENVLLRLLVPDNNILLQATNELKEAFKNPVIIGALLSTLAGSCNAQVRQYAAILLRRKISKTIQWAQLNDEAKHTLKEQLLKLLISEPEKVVKNSIAQIIGSVAKHELLNNHWPELLFFLNQSSNSNSLAEREIGMFTFNIVTSMAAEQLKPHLQGLISLFSKTLQDPNPTVTSLTVQTLTNLVACIGTAELNKFQPLIPITMKVIRTLISTDEEEAALCMDLYEELLEIEVAVIVPHIKAVIQMCLEISSNSGLSENIRVKALSVIYKVIKMKKKVVIKNNLISPILATIFPIMCNPLNKDADNTEEDEDEDDTQSVDSFAPQVLYVMSLYLPPEKLFPALLKFMEPALCDTNIYSRKAGYTALALLAEGCSEHIRHKHLHTFLQVICRGMTDQSSFVRNSALFTLGQFSEYLQPEISEFHAELMPVLFDYLGNICNQLQNGINRPPNITGVFFALEMFCENLDERLLPYLPALMERLMTFFPATNCLEAKELAISAIGATSHAAKEAMVPYFPQIIQQLKPYLQIQPSGTALPIQVQAIDTLGILARTIGSETFQPMAQECIQMGLELVDKVHDPDIRRACYSLFASVATVLESDMAPYMATVVDHMIDSLISTEGIVPHYDETNTAFTLFEDLEDEESLGDEEEDEDDVIGHSVENSYLEEKEDTCCALRELAAKTGPAFLPYFERCFQEVLKLLDHPASDVRKPAVVALGQFTITLSQAALQSNSQVQQTALNQTLAVLVPKLLTLSREDDERHVVLAAFEILGDLFKELKVLMLDHATLEGVADVVNDTFKHKLACQDNSDFGEDDADENDAEYDGMLLEFAGELVPSMAKALPHTIITPYLEKILPCLISKTGPKCSVSERSFSVGTLAETVLALGKGGISSLIQPFLPLFLDAMKDEDEEVRSNGVFGLGVLVENGGDFLLPQYPNLLQALSLMLVKESDPRARDNICSAVARLIITSPTAVPLKQVFPVLLRCLPLQADFEENKTVYACLYGLFFNKRDEILETLPQILKIISVVSQPSEISKLQEETKIQLAEIVKVCHHDYQTQFQSIVSSLPMDAQGILMSIIAT